MRDTDLPHPPDEGADTGEYGEGFVREYVDWDAETSFVISGPLPRGTGAGRRFTHAEADRWVRATYRVLFKIPAAKTPGRWAYRVLRPNAPGGRYTPPQES